MAATMHHCCWEGDRGLHLPGRAVGEASTPVWFRGTSCWSLFGKDPGGRGPQGCTGIRSTLCSDTRGHRHAPWPDLQCMFHSVQEAVLRKAAAKGPGSQRDPRDSSPSSSNSSSEETSEPCPGTPQPAQTRSPPGCPHGQPSRQPSSAEEEPGAWPQPEGLGRQRGGLPLVFRTPPSPPISEMMATPAALWGAGVQGAVEVGILRLPPSPTPAALGQYPHL